MKPLTIDKIKTGEGLAGTRVALLFAPPDAPAGSLVGLTNFLNKYPDVRVLPGYSGKEPAHVLRISGFQRDDELKVILTKKFPVWQEQHAKEDTPPIHIPVALQFGSLRNHEAYPHYAPLKRFVKERANGLTALAYMVGNTALLFSARRGLGANGSKNTDWFKAYSSVAYNVATVTLAVLGHEAERPQDVDTLMHRLYPRLQDADTGTRQAIQTVNAKSLAFLKRHPWEISSAINMTGAASHMASAMKRRGASGNQANYEALAALGTMVAMSISFLIPEKHAATPMDTSEIFDREAGDNMLATADGLKKYEEKPGQTLGSIRRFKDWSMQHPLALSAGVSVISNLGYGLAATRSRPWDIGLLTMSGSYIFGNTLQAQAQKIHSSNFDELVTAAADMIRADPLLTKEDPKKIEERIAKFAGALSRESQIVQRADLLAEGIRARLNKVSLGNERKIYLPEEAHIFKDSPFVSRRFVQRVQEQGNTGPVV